MRILSAIFSRNHQFSMRYIRIFIITAQHIFEYKARVFVWFIMSVINPLMLILFWTGVSLSSGLKQQWNPATIISYYMLLTFFDSALMCHIEQDIWRMDIAKGDLATYLLKPIPYFWKKFLEEIPYRFVQGSFALVLLLIIILFLKNFTLAHSLPLILGAILCCLLALYLSFTFKMTLGLLALWIIQANGLFQLFEIGIFVFGGYVVPLFLLPKALAIIAYILPFSYMIYFPVIATQGALSLPSLFLVLGIQMLWIGIFTYIYRMLWKAGLNKFTAVGR